MLASSIPTSFPVPFAGAAGASYIRTIPAASQIGTTAGAASLTDGFPPLNFVALLSGGTPMSGKDLNGILNQITKAIQWQQAGNMAGYNSAFSTAIGGYPAGSILQNAGKTNFWLSTADNNTTNPDANGAGWSVLYVMPSDLANEVTARTNADSALTANLAAEVTARTNADSALQTNINAKALLAGDPLVAFSALTANAGDNDTSVATTAFVYGVKVFPGMIAAYAGTTVPFGYLACPLAAANISRATYSALFAAIGTAWGAGDGLTTFGIPFFAADQVPVQQWGGAGAAGTTTVGVMPAHVHSEIITTSATSYFMGGTYSGFAISAPTGGLTGPAGIGTVNLPAGSRVQYCVKY
jgi:Phage Tail Collar Domain